MLQRQCLSCGYAGDLQRMSLQFAVVWLQLTKRLEKQIIVVFTEPHVTRYSMLNQTHL